MTTAFRSLVLIFSAMFGCCSAAQSQEGPSAEQSGIKNPYMGAPVELDTASNGAIANKRLLDGVRKVAWLEPTIEEPAKGVWVFGGYALAPIAVIEAEDGLIVIDTGDTKPDGDVLLKAIRTKTSKPIKVIIYGHSHTVMGAGVIAEGNKQIKIIGHPDLNTAVDRLIKSGGTAFYPELGPYLAARSQLQFNTFMPKQGPDSYVVPKVLPAMQPAFLPVNTPVTDGQEMDVLGIRMQFFTKYGSDDQYHTTIWLPDRKILVSTLLWSSPPQLYSVRGDLFRDPSRWIEGLKFQRDLGAEVLVSLATRPIVGKDEVRRRFEGYLDGASFVLDQSLRGILGGKGPDELRHSVVFPSYLREVPNNLESYGEISSYAPAIYYYAIGWYDNNAANLKPLAHEDVAKRIVPLMGGREKVLTAAKEALNKREYAWAAQLVDYLYRLAPQDIEVRKTKAEALRQMAYVSTGANDRSHLMSQALALEGKVNIPRLVFPASRTIVESPTTFVNYFRVRIDPDKSGLTDRFLRFDFSNGESAGLHIRRAVAEFIADPGNYHRTPDMTLAMSAQTWAKIYLGLASPKELIDAGDIKILGDVSEAERLLNLFDRYSPEKEFVIPPMSLENR